MADIEKKGPLAGLSDDDLKALLECSKLREFKTDDVVLKQGQHNASLYVVMQGLLHVRRHGEGRQVLLGRLEPGGFFGDISLFDPGPTTASVVAVSPGKVLEITGEDVEKSPQRAHQREVLQRHGAEPQAEQQRRHHVAQDQRDRDRQERG